MLYSSRTFPTWHFSMVNDADRNKKIESALRSIDIEGKSVFEIGTGAGLTAMLFARLGAGRILTCETDTQLYGIAKKVFAANNLENRIELVNMCSSDVVTSGVLDFSPDIIFTETLDCGVVGEGFSSIKSDILRIISDNTTVIPSIIRQYGYIVESKDIYNLNFADHYRDYDLSLLNIHSTRNYFPIRAILYRSRVLAPTFLMRELNYTTPHDEIYSVVLNAHLDGTCHGIISYFEAGFGPYFVTNDLRSTSHWHQSFHPLQKPSRILAGRTYRLVFDFNGTAQIEEHHNEQI